MFQERLKKILQIIDYELYHVTDGQITLKDQKNHGKSYYDVLSYPYSMMSDDHTRRIDCTFEPNRNWVQVRSINLLDSKDIPFVQASSLVEGDKNDYCSFEVEKNGTLFDMTIGRKNNEAICEYRMMENYDNHPIVVDVCYTPSKFVITRRDVPKMEEIVVQKSGRCGRVTFIKNHEVLEDTVLSIPYEEAICGAMSCVNHVVEKGSRLLQDVHRSMIHSLTEQYPFYLEFLSYLADSYDCDSIDSLLQKHHIFLDEEVGKEKR